MSFWKIQHDESSIEVIQGDSNKSKEYEREAMLIYDLIVSKDSLTCLAIAVRMEAETFEEMSTLVPSNAVNLAPLAYQQSAEVLEIHSQGTRLLETEHVENSLVQRPSNGGGGGDT